MRSGEIDPERMALLLEGKLPEPARSELLAQLASSDEELGVLADASSVLSEGQAAPSASAPTRWPRWFDRRGWYALAAAILIVAALPIMRGLRRQGSADPANFASILIADGRAPGIDAPFAAWSATRSVDGPFVSPPGRSVRLGARSTDLDIALRNRDPRAATIATDMATLLDAIPGAGPVAQTYRSVAAQFVAGSDASRLVEQGRLALRRLPGDSLVVLGAWVEAARLAAHQRDARFFDRRETSDMLARAQTLSPVPESARPTLSSLQTAAAADEAEWQRRERLLGQLLLALGL